uniref:Uncharacterized protein n=1 Tax=uncultured bacterium A1Q1_fos_485 TaxID=1256576 RepID=L7VUB9_9BACT|nr:hypothetical protein [uncultured bacterium A1Q1_fos_485]
MCRARFPTTTIIAPKNTQLQTKGCSLFAHFCPKTLRSPFEFFV